MSNPIDSKGNLITDPEYERNKLNNIIDGCAENGVKHVVRALANPPPTSCEDLNPTCPPCARAGYVSFAHARGRLLGAPLQHCAGLLRGGVHFP